MKDELIKPVVKEKKNQKQEVPQTSGSNLVGLVGGINQDRDRSDFGKDHGQPYYGAFPESSEIK